MTRHVPLRRARQVAGAQQSEIACQVVPHSARGLVMSGQNEDQTSRRKFLKGAGLVGAATVATPAAANTVPSQSEWSPEQISKLEEIVKNFITNAQASNIQPLDSCARLMGHGSHNNEGSRARAAPATRTAPTRK
ncbi:MAG: twin-arginine translocation signal domain-containing protein [Alphaproteobacteria bacterium]|nr:MAG: twin-arginine translocation signal domain-containing protein [Alphaproteobacteria bacterium]